MALYGQTAGKIESFSQISCKSQQRDKHTHTHTNRIRIRMPQCRISTILAVIIMIHGVLAANINYEIFADYGKEYKSHIYTTEK